MDGETVIGFAIHAGVPWEIPAALPHILPLKIAHLSWRHSGFKEIRGRDKGSNLEL